MAEVIISSSAKEITKIIREELQSLFKEHGLDSRILDEENKNGQKSHYKERLSQQEACSLIGVSLPTLYRLIKEGKFKQYSIGKKRFLRRSEIIKALEE